MQFRTNQLIPVFVGFLLLIHSVAIGQGPPQGLTKENAKALAKLIEKDWKQKPEWAVMMSSILAGEDMGPNLGWFKPSQTRLDWNWLAKQFDSNNDAKITKEEGKRFAKVFDSIDMNKSGDITAVDFDWSKVSHVGPSKPSEAIFFLLDRDSNGRVDRQEILQWMAMMDEQKRGYVTPDEFSKGLSMIDDYLKSQSSKDNSDSAPSPKKREPSAEERNRMLNLLLAGELGTFTEGPSIGELAPDFQLSQLKAEAPVQLSSFRGEKIVVLNFGSFT